MDDLDSTSESLVVDNPSVSAAEKLIRGVGGAIASLSYLAWLALWIWSIVLVYRNWGQFWGIWSILTPPLSLPIVFVMCFFWGKYYFAIGVLGAIFGSVSLVAVELKPKTSGMIMVGLSCATAILFVMLAISDTQALIPINADERTKLTDDALALIAVTQSFIKEDPSTAASRPEAIDKLTSRFKNYDAARITFIQDVVQKYLRYEDALFEDLSQQIANESLVLSKNTVALNAMLPDRVRDTLSLKPDDLVTLRALFGRLSGDAAATMRRNFETLRERRHKEYEHIFKRVAGRDLNLEVQ